MNETGPVTAMHFVRTFPWLRLGRAIGCALSPTQLLLAVVGVFLVTLIQDVLIERPDFGPGFMHLPWQKTGALLLEGTVTPEAELMSPPLTSVMVSFRGALSPQAGRWKQAVIALSAFVIWTIIGVAICRSTAVQFCRDTGPSFRLCLQWSLGRLVNSLAAIVTPLGGVLALGVGMLLCTLPGILPGLGTLWLHMAAPVITLIALAAGVILALLPFLWPLMVAAVAVDGSDSFDAFSRSFSLVTTRFWSAAALGFLAFLAAWLLTLGWDLVDRSTAMCVQQFALAVLGEQGDQTLISAIAWWKTLFMRGAMASFFWSQATIVYLLLRHTVDGTPLDCLAGYDDDMRFHEPFPVVGIAGAANTAPEQP